MKIAIGSDHAGFELKEKLKRLLEGRGFEITDHGTHSADSVDYPDYAHKVANDVAAKAVDRGILVCWTGNGMVMTANKVAGVRAGLCMNERMAELTRQHNDANVLCLPSLFVDEETSLVIAERFLTTEFEGGRHSRRVSKIEHSESESE